MYPTLIDRKPLHQVLNSMSASLDINQEVVSRGGGYNDHIMFGRPDDINDLARVLKRAGFAYITRAIGESKVLTVKFIWTPENSYE
jgi:hypothetical protein